ncbi:MAG: hypothetical protein IKT98_05460 [Selenomonadaceae bacterium]|nr:hypothetical protein [Selenomonadaceae bacterium]
MGTIEDVLTELADDDETSGIILNPDDDNLRFVLEKEDLEEILNRTPPENKMLSFDGNIEESHADAIVSSDFEDFKYLSFENSDDVKAAHFMKKSPNNDDMRIIYTPLMFYSGTDEDVIKGCYFSCLELAKKYHLSRIVFPKQFDSPLMERVVQVWFTMNEDCGMTVFVERDIDDDIDDNNDQDCPPADYRNEPITETNSVDSAKAEAYRNLVERTKNQYLTYDSKVKVTAAHKQETDKFAATFDSKQDFWKELQYRCAKWEKSDNTDLNDERARESLTIAIANGYKLEDPVALFAPVVNGVNICDEINLYTYWQGFGYAQKTPKIKYLLVAQDWGAFYNESAEPFKETINQINAGKDMTYPIISVTSKNLVELFKILERDITKSCDDVFFTNFCLGYRIGNESGGMTKELMMRNANLFRELCEILEPENILCLGKLVFECVYESLSGHKFNKIYRGYKGYNDFLDNHPQFVVPYGNGKVSNFYPLAHCGSRGTAKTNRPLDKQKQEWKRIKDDDIFRDALYVVHINQSGYTSDYLFDSKGKMHDVPDDEKVTKFYDRLPDLS